MALSSVFFDVKCVQGSKTQKASKFAWYAS